MIGIDEATVDHANGEWDAPLGDPRWEDWKAKGILLARGGEMYLIEVPTPLLVADARTWGNALYEELVQAASSQDATDRVGFRGFSKEEQSERLDDLEMWLSYPEGYADRIEWLYPLSLRQQVLPEVLTVVTLRDLDKLVDAVIANAFSLLRLDPIAGLEVPIAKPVSANQLQQISVYAREAFNEAVKKEEQRFSPVEWMFTDGQAHPPATAIAGNLFNALFLAGISPTFSNRLVPLLYASQRFAEIEHRGPLLAAVTMPGSDAEFINEAVRAVLENTLARAEAPQ